MDIESDSESDTHQRQEKKKKNKNTQKKAKEAFKKKKIDDKLDRLEKNLKFRQKKNLKKIDLYKKKNRKSTKGN